MNPSCPWYFISAVTTWKPIDYLPFIALAFVLLGVGAAIYGAICVGRRRDLRMYAIAQLLRPLGMRPVSPIRTPTPPLPEFQAARGRTDLVRTHCGTVHGWMAQAGDIVDRRGGGGVS